MRDLIDRVRLNWESLAIGDRRKLKIAVGVMLFVLIVLVAGIYDTIDRQQKKRVESLEPTVTDMSKTELSDRPGTHFLDSLAAKNAAYERQYLREKIKTINGEAAAFRNETQRSFEEVDQKLDQFSGDIQRVGKSLDELALGLARERSVRRAQAELMPKNMPANPSVNLPSTVEVQPKSNNGVVYLSPFNLMDIAVASELSMPSLGSVEAVVSAGDLLAANPVPESLEPAAKTASNLPQQQGQTQQNTDQQVSQSTSTVEVASYDSGDVSRIPAGSLIKANLISGLDAPVGQTAQQNPHPIMAKVVGRVLLPNGHYADLSGCVMLASGYGDLSSERVFMQTASISCVSKQREIYETKVESSALGPDGKVGIRGSVITKDGALIARNMQAGAVQGLALAFSGGVNNMQVQTDQPFALPNTEYIGRSMIGQGISNSLDAMIDRYNKIMDQITPVIEVHAGTHVEFQVLRGFDVTVAR